MNQQTKLKADTVIVGSGPGGATIARELAQKGKDVLVLEKGKHHTWPVGNMLAYATMYDIKKSKQGLIVRRGITTGGSTMLYSANAYDPPEFISDELGIDLSSEVAETKKQLRIKSVPEEFYRDYIGTRRLVDAAGDLGHTMKTQERFIDYKKCDPSCDSCLFGCKKQAKWTAREYLEDAVRMGAKLVTQADVQSVETTAGHVSGLQVNLHGKRRFVEAERIIMCAGGIGTPIILQRSGIHEAGKQFFMDPMSIVVGVMKEGKGTFHEMTYTFADESNVGQFIYGNVGAVNAFASQVIKLNLPYFKRGIQIKGMVGMFVKLCDEPSGSIDINGRISKTFTKNDNKSMASGVKIVKEVMIRAGVEPDTIAVAKGIGGHPGGTAAIGTVVDENLMTSVDQLYVCDNSIMPKSGGVPPVLTLIALGKKFARSLLQTPA